MRPVFLDFWYPVFRLLIRLNLCSVLCQSHTWHLDFSLWFSGLACFFGFSLWSDCVMLFLEMSIVIAFILTSIVTIVTSISNTSQASSFLSLLLFNRSLILKVTIIDRLSLWSCGLWFDDLLTLVELVFIFLTGFNILSLVIKSLLDYYFLIFHDY